MAGKAPHLTSTTFVESVQRRCSLPESDSLYSPNDILELANDQIQETLVPTIKATQEEYFVTNMIVPLESGKSRYSIPERSVANQLRAASYLDDNGGEYKLSRISREDRYDFQFNGSQPYCYYLENDSLVLYPDITDDSGSLKLTYLLRPNNLVTSDRVAKIQLSSEGFILVSSITNSTVTTFVTTTSHHLSTGESVTVTSVTGVNNSILNGEHLVTVVDSNSFTIAVDTTAEGAFVAGVVYNNTTNYIVNNLPTIFTASDSVDFLKTKSPHNTLAIDIFPKTINFISKTLNFKNSDIPANLAIGDTIALSYETDIPGVPTELHRHLVTLTCELVLEGIKDAQGLGFAKARSAQSKMNAEILIENRVTGAPLKIKPSFGLLKGSRRKRF